ncbi:MAG: hypothetical protein ACOYS2_00220 [Patescibacteria group bacterium]
METLKQEAPLSRQEEIQKEIEALEKRRNGITDWGDTDPRDYVILDQIDARLEKLRAELAQSQEK